MVADTPSISPKLLSCSRYYVYQGGREGERGRWREGEREGVRKRVNNGVKEEQGRSPLKKGIIMGSAVLGHYSI